MMKAVIDRFEGDYAILIVGENEQRLNVPRKQLPSKAKAGAWLKLDMVGGQPTNIAIDDQATTQALQRIGDKLAHLRKGDHNK
jgi:hypothetical protein